jgi:hypothetical protein
MARDGEEGSDGRQAGDGEEGSDGWQEMERKTVIDGRQARDGEEGSDGRQARDGEEGFLQFDIHTEHIASELSNYHLEVWCFTEIGHSDLRLDLMQLMQLPQSDHLHPDPAQVSFACGEKSSEEEGGRESERGRD